MLSVLLLTVASDQGTKRWARATLHPGMTQDLLRGHVQLTLAKNRGGFLSLGDKLPPAIRFVVFTLFVCIGLIGGAAWLMRFTGRAHHMIAFALLVGGGMSNFIDRVVSHGAVTDFMVIRLGSGPLRRRRAHERGHDRLLRRVAEEVSDAREACAFRGEALRVRVHSGFEHTLVTHGPPACRCHDYIPAMFSNQSARRKTGPNKRCNVDCFKSDLMGTDKL